ncbi:MAG: DUF6273 domain-containing protein, partial [Acutalibacteraceae bacterium]
MQKQIKRTVAVIMAIIMTIACAPLAGIHIGMQSKAASYKVGDIIKFGSYPQSKVTDSKTLSALNKLSLKWVSYDYYAKNQKSSFMKYADVTYNSNKYRAVKFTKYRPIWATGDFTPLEDKPNQYKNGYKVNTIYWFKYEPLKWRILDPKTGLVMSEKLIDSQEYNVTSNCFTDEDEWVTLDYQTSSIRKWLNSNFYNTAFNETEKSKTFTTTIDNSVKDKLYLLSFEDITNTKYGFNSDEYFDDKARQASGTDYAKCQGLQLDYLTKNYSAWWLRVSNKIISTHTCPVTPYGGIDGGFMYDGDITFIGVRPVMCINLTTAPAQVKGVKASSKTSSSVTL